ncbi:importin subunit beta-like [Drosophila tropicalis]|uniref:importin subunit beta-like n=1 Tax=Drosophila tropicalis TaxID=46794 RepID=UPI0035ABB581
MASSNEELVDILEKTVSLDTNELVRAQNYLDKAAAANFLNFLWELSEILANPSQSDVARAAAGLQLKNRLSDDEQNIVKRNVLSALRTEKTRPSCAALCAANIAVRELPTQYWSNLIPDMVHQATDQSSTEMQRGSALQAIGYICQDIPHDVPDDQRKLLLNVIIYGMSNFEFSNRVRLIATQALLNSLEVAKAYFKEKSQSIMKIVCELAQCSDPKICVAALQCLVKTTTLYYQHMEPYMAQALLPISLQSIKSQNVEISLQGIEFWSNMSDKEVELHRESQQQACELKHYASGACPFLAPLLFEKLTQQNENYDEDIWNPAKASSVCLMLLASCCEDMTVAHVMPFIRENLDSPNWHFRAAAVLAMGSIFDGIKSNSLQPVVQQLMPTLIGLVGDPRPLVSETTIWTMVRICHLMPEVLIHESYLQSLLNCLSTTASVNSKPRVAVQTCEIIIKISKVAYEEAIALEGEPPNTYCLTPYFRTIVNHLLEMTDRSDSGQANLSRTAYQAMVATISSCPLDCFLSVQSVVIVVLGRLDQILAIGLRMNDPMNRRCNELQSLLCELLKAVLGTYNPQDAKLISDDVMRILLMFQLNAVALATHQQNALETISTLVHLLGKEFVKYMPDFKDLLITGLQNCAQPRVCRAAVKLSGIICCSLEDLIVPYSDDIMSAWLSNLSNPDFPSNIKPNILSAIGDMASTIGNKLLQYLDTVLEKLRIICEVQIDATDINEYGLQKCINDLHETVIDAYIGIIHGLERIDDGQHVSRLEPELVHIIGFIKRLVLGEDVTVTKMANAALLLSDLCDALEESIKPFLNDPVIAKLAAKQNSEDSAHSLASLTEDSSST